MAELPADVRSAIQAADLDQKVRAVGEKHQLHIDQIGELGDETLLAMLGFSPLETLDKRLSEALSISPEAGAALATDLGTEVFGSIRESMKKFTEKSTLKPQELPKAEPAPLAMPKAEAILTEKTVQKVDPYREPV